MAKNSRPISNNATQFLDVVVGISSHTTSGKISLQKKFEGNRWVRQALNLRTQVSYRLVEKLQEKAVSMTQACQVLQVSQLDYYAERSGHVLTVFT